MTLEVDIAATYVADAGEPFAVEASFAVAAGETLALLGPSGAGKTLLLETIAGVHPHGGAVSLGGEPVSDRPPERRGFGFVFQDFALFPHLSARENVAFGQRYREGRRTPDELLRALGVADLADRRPATLSGGERQRVALARALAVDPDVLLLDEPLSSLDPPTRASLRRDLHRTLADVTAVYVTHDRTTAGALADRIAVMRDGEIVQTGRPDVIFDAPASPFVAAFTGSNCLRLESGSPLGEVLPAADGTTGIGIRPEHVVVADPGDGLRATVERVTREEAAYRVTLSVAGTDVEAYTTTPPATGATVGVRFPDEHVTCFRGEGSITPESG